MGSHPHVVQPFEVVRESGCIKAVVAYSLGNFVTNQMSTDWRDQKKQSFQFPSRASVLIGLSIKKEQGQILISEPFWIPLYMAPKNLIGGDRRKVLLAYPELHTGDLLKKQISDANRIIQARLGGEAQILSRAQIQNIFQNIKW